MKRLLVGLMALGVLFTALPLSAGQFYGGRGYLHTNSALLMPPGALDVSFFARGYTTPVEGESYLASNGTSAIATAFGFTRRVELGFTQILYQDLNVTPTAGEKLKALVPGDTYIRFKISGYNVTNSVFWGVMPALRYRVGRFHDVHMEPYESEGIEGELTWMLSWFKKPFYPDEDLSVHLNLGYINHNDKAPSGDISQSVNYLISALYPKRVVDFGFELYGSNFLVRPPEKVLAREDWMYATPFMRYKLFKGLVFTMGLDVLLIGKEDTSTPTNRNLTKYPNYSEWRLTGRVSFIPSTAFYIAPTFVKANEAGGGRERRSVRGTGEGGSFDRQSLFRWAVEEGGGVEAADLDLKKIRQERIKAEEDLRRLKRELEEKQRKGK